VPGRRFGRIIVLSALYQMDIANTPKEKILKLDWVEKKITEELKEFIFDLINGTLEHLEEIDSLIKEYSTNWKFERIAPIDKAILRFSIYCLLYKKDIPENVVIDEAIELSKIYSSEKSYKFINGILDGIKNKKTKEKPV